MGSDIRRAGSLPVLNALMLLVITFALTVLSILPSAVSSLLGPVPSLVPKDLPGALSLLVCSIILLVSIVRSGEGPGSAGRYMLSGSILSAFVGGVLFTVGLSMLSVSVMEWKAMGPDDLLASGSLSGLLLLLLSAVVAVRTWRVMGGLVWR